ncbi:MAG: nuclear transport factor 2 family protein [Bacteroidota bacterium]|nr:nuclear transport factor 2 family protein [Bacteroidota bacterium]
MKISNRSFSKYQMIFGLLAFVLLTFTACESDQDGDAKTAERPNLIPDANALDSLYLVAFNNGDVDALMNLHWNSPELIAYPTSEMKISGFDAVKSFYTKDFAASKGAVLTYTSTYNIPMHDAVVGHGTFTWTMPMEGGPPMVMEGRYADVKAYKDGKMVITFDHSSVPTPPAPADSTDIN